ncbi:class A beta-lactamase [Propionivibrio soli]|uniref:class A beta-lactamase n=1 Tax=Propionivibrio soli TaxID=2976531 RepID=UPI0021E74AA5|nr:class A beta-lactamase [Propionivibrio soli]
MDRRRFISLTPAAVLPLLAINTRNSFASADLGTDAAHARLRALEATSGGRLGVHILDTATGAQYGNRSDERFMMLSSFKLAASAFALYRDDQGQDSIQRRITYAKKDLVEWSPVTEKHADGNGMSLAELCEATLVTSDNTAANLILKSFGGPAGLTGFIRQIGDTVTRFDRYETELNNPHPTEPMDTTTPRAMAETVRSLVLGNVLSEKSRQLLRAWLVGNQTGGKRLKAGLPENWIIADKTGTSRRDMADIGVIWAGARSPFVVTAYLAGATGNAAAKESTYKEIGRLIAGLSD